MSRTSPIQKKLQQLGDATLAAERFGELAAEIETSEVELPSDSVVAIFDRLQVHYPHNSAGIWAAIRLASRQATGTQIANFLPMLQESAPQYVKQTTTQALLNVVGRKIEVPEQTWKHLRAQLRRNAEALFCIAEERRTALDRSLLLATLQALTVLNDPKTPGYIEKICLEEDLIFRRQLRTRLVRVEALLSATPSWYEEALQRLVPAESAPASEKTTIPILAI